MRRRGAREIVNLSSMGGKLTFPGGGAYHATKHAVEALSDALRCEVRGFGVRVVIVEPGLITTALRRDRRRLDRRCARGDPDAGAEDPYAAFNAAVGSATAAIYEGPLHVSAAAPRRWPG